MGYRGPLPRGFVNWYNARMVAARASPRWGAWFSRRLTVITYTGRRSGSTFSTPVAYRRTGNRVTIPVGIPDAKKWWRNFTGAGGPITLNLDGVDRSGHAVARRDRRHVRVAVELDD